MVLISFVLETKADEMHSSKIDQGIYMSHIATVFVRNLIRNHFHLQTQAFSVFLQQDAPE